MKLLFLGLGTQEIVVIALLVLLFFGAKRIPDLMKGLGKGIKNFKDEMNGTDKAEDQKDRSNEGEKQ